MKNKALTHPDREILPILAHESLYLGVDIGKKTHVAGFLSSTLLTRYQRFEHCPALTFDNTREGFRSLIDRIKTYVPLTQVYAVYVRYNQGTKQALLPLPEPLRDRGRGLSFSLQRNAPWQRYAGNSIHWWHKTNWLAPGSRGKFTFNLPQRRLMPMVVASTTISTFA
jgi:hypothetical protein